MNPILQEWLEKQRQKEQQERQMRRDSHLYELGLVDSEKTKTVYFDNLVQGAGFDHNINKWCKECQAPIEVTDEEYAEICKYVPEEVVEEESPADTSAESTLEIFAIIFLIAGLLGALGLFIAAADTHRGGGALVISGVVTAAVGLFNWSVLKVLAQISRTLKDIKYKK